MVHFFFFFFWLEWDDGGKLYWTIKQEKNTVGMEESQDRRSLGQWYCGATIPAPDSLYVVYYRGKNKILSCLSQWCHGSLCQHLDMYANRHTAFFFSLQPYSNTLAIVICVVLDTKKWRIANIKEFILESHNRKVQIKSRNLIGKPMFSHCSFLEEFIVFIST